MTTNPIYNALLGVLYISGIAGVLSIMEHYLRDTPDTFLAPIAMLSLFVLSAIVMASIFFYQPLMLYLDGKKQESVSLVFKTVAVFALLTFLALIANIVVTLAA